MKITASALRVGRDEGNLRLEASHNLIFDICKNIIINTEKIDASNADLLIQNISAQDISARDISARDISARNIYLPHKNNIHFGTETLSNLLQDRGLEGDASLSNVDISGILIYA